MTPNPIINRFMTCLQEIESTRDIRRLAEMFAEDAELTNMATHRTEHGRDGAEAFWREYLRVFRDVHSEFHHTVQNDRQAVLEWSSEGHVHQGSVIRYRGVSILEFEGDQVKRFRTYYDSAAFLAHSTYRNSQPRKEMERSQSV